MKFDEFSVGDRYSLWNPGRSDYGLCHSQLIISNTQPQLVMHPPGDSTGGEPSEKKLKSQASRILSFVRFQNTTNRSVDVIWLNYDGKHVKYSTVGPRQFLDVNTFVSHYWMFKDSKTGESLVIQKKCIFEPESWRRHQANGRAQRTTVYITIPVYTLTERCLHEVRKLVQRCDIPSLELPHTLITKLMSINNEKHYLKPPWEHWVL